MHYTCTRAPTHRPIEIPLMRSRVLAVVAVLIVGLVVAGGVYLNPIAPVATGYAAKTICSGHFVSGRAVTDVSEDLPSNPLVPFLQITHDNSAGTVRATLMGLWGSSAWFTPGRGCTLANRDPGFTSADPIRASRLPRGDVGPQVRQDLDAAVDAAFAEDDPQGRARNTRAVVVLHEGRLVAEQYAPGFDADTPMLGWSMGKSVANAVVGRLVHEGVLDVEQSDLRPRWAGDQRSEITLDHLLHMTSGLAFEEVYDPNTDATNMLFRPRDTGAFAADKELVADPGERWSYSSGTTNIICDVAAEAVDGSDLDVVRDLVFAPLGMASAIMEPDAAGDPVCSSFPYATARDWARFGQFFLQDGQWEGQRLLPEDWVDYSTEPVALQSEAPYGAGWWLNTGADGSRRMPDVAEDAFWASGNEGQQVVVVPSADVVVVRLGLSQEFDGVEWGLEELVSDVTDAVG